MATHDRIERSESRVEVRGLGPADAAAAATVLVQAFDHDAAKLAMMPNSEARRAIIKLTLRARLDAALRYGTVHGAEVDDELGAIAVWYPPGVAKFSSSGAIRMLFGLPSIMASLAKGIPHIVRTFSSDVRGAVALFRQRGPAVVRATQGMTWQLDLLGTLPEHRRKGLARALLNRQLQRCDEDSAAVWLETTDPVNTSIYKRFGFKTVAHVDGPEWLLGHWVMRREPHAVQVTN